MTSLVCALLAVMVASPAPGDMRQRAREVLDADYQRQLPLDPESGGSGALAGGVERGEGRAGDRSRDLRPASPRRRGELTQRERHSPFGPLGSLAQMLLWIFAAAAVVLGVAWVGRELSGFRGDVVAGGSRNRDPAELDAPDRAVVERPLGDADELARQGQFGAAIHILLLRTLRELAHRLPERLPASLTSREILARVRIPDEARRALAALVGAVEISHFGGLEPGPGDFDRCRHHFQHFARAYLAGGAMKEAA